MFALPRSTAQLALPAFPTNPAPDTSTAPSFRPVEATRPAHAALPILPFQRSRVRTMTQVDVLSFVAACPSCGADCSWTEQREDTRMLVTVSCPCADATNILDATRPA